MADNRYTIFLCVVDNRYALDSITYVDCLQTAGSQFIAGEEIVSHDSKF